MEDKGCGCGSQCGCGAAKNPQRVFLNWKDSHALSTGDSKYVRFTIPCSIGLEGFTRCIIESVNMYDIFHDFTQNPPYVIKYLGIHVEEMGSGIQSTGERMVLEPTFMVPNDQSFSGSSAGFWSSSGTGNLLTPEAGTPPPNPFNYYQVISYKEVTKGAISTECRMHNRILQRFTITLTDQDMVELVPNAGVNVGTNFYFLMTLRFE